MCSRGERRGNIQREPGRGRANFISGEPPRFPQDVEVKIRYRSSLVPAVLYPPEDGSATVVFPGKAKSCDPEGQCSILPREEVLGGGTIVSG